MAGACIPGDPNWRTSEADPPASPRDSSNTSDRLDAVGAGSDDDDLAGRWKNPGQGGDIDLMRY